MQRASFIFTILFMLLGPIKVIPGFLKATRGRDSGFKREVAIKATLVASAIVAVVGFLGQGMVAKYEISLPAVQLAGGLVLLLSALKAIFPGVEQVDAEASAPTATQLAFSPVATPVIVTPAGIAALLIFVLIAPRHPGMEMVIAAVVAALMLLDFLVMYFVDPIAKVPGFIPLLAVFGAVLTFIQVALAIEAFEIAFRGLGVLPPR